MSKTDEAELAEGKFTGLSINISGAGKVELTHLLSKNNETSVYGSSRADLLIKVFDLECGKADEVSYGPYLSYGLEVENFQDIQEVEELRHWIPACYGANIEVEKRYAFIVMEYLHGENLLSWCEQGARAGYPVEWASDFRATVYQTLTIVSLFHKHGIILIDFKPDNVIKLAGGGVKFVDLGAFLTPRHSRETDKYVYSATPDYAELVIDTSNVQTGIPLNQRSDIFAAGVALFAMATGDSRLAIPAENAATMLQLPSVYRFRDTQIKDVWHAYPHLKEVLPLVETQLKDGRILFSEFWHVLKGYLTAQSGDWETAPEEQHRASLLSLGAEFIAAELPPPLKWLAHPIAQATTLRRFRLDTVSELMNLLADPVPESTQTDVARYNGLALFGGDMDPPVELAAQLNVWDVRLNPQTGHWAIYAPLAALRLRSVAAFTFLREIARDEEGHRFFQVVGDTEADAFEGTELTLAHLADDHSAWIG